MAALSPHFEDVHGNDRDEIMRQHAANRCSAFPNVTIHDGTWSEVDGPVDLVTMVAVLHHLEVVAALREVSHRLEPGGRFLSVGLAPPRGPVDNMWDLASIVTNPVIGYVKHPWPNPHGVQQPLYPVQDPTTPYDELREILAELMPGASMRRRLGFRHTIVWTKPA